MSEFWKYFHDVLRWPLIHSPGPLQALAHGLALCMDTATEDEVYLRRQFFPTLCETAMVAEHGQSRGIIRHATETPEQYRSRVARAYAWHKLGGKTLGLPEILRFYGFDALRIDSLRQWTPSRWAEFQVGLTTPATQAEQAELLAALDTLVWLANEYKPARSVLARIYTDTYNLYPTVWGEDIWGAGLWSQFSGVSVPELGEDNLIVSFGMRLSLTCAALAPLFGMGMTSRLSFLAPHIDKATWGRSEWGDIFPCNHAFAFGQVYSSYFGDVLTAPLYWRGAWDKRRWHHIIGIGRKLTPWVMGTAAVSRSQAVYGEACKPWGDLNTRYGATIARHIDAPDAWGLSRFGDSQGLRFEVLHELTLAVTRLLTAAVAPGVPVMGTSVNAAYLIPYLDSPVWGQSPWSEPYPRNHGFSGQAQTSSFFGDRLVASRCWTGTWSAQPWQRYTGIGRKLTPWVMDGNAVARSQAVYGEPGKAWGESNSRYGTTVSRSIDAPAIWGTAHYGDAQGLRYDAIHEVTQAATSMQCDKVSPPVPLMGCASHTASMTQPVWQSDTWSGRWNIRPWSTCLAYFVHTTIQGD